MKGFNNSEQGHRRIDEITITGRGCPENYQESGRRNAGSSPCGVDSRIGQRVYSTLVYAGIASV